MTPLLGAVAVAEERLDATVCAMSDAEAAQPSRLPGWTRAEVVTHLARNAESNSSMVAARLRGEQRPQYPGGRSQRAAGIEAGRGRTAAEVLHDLRATVVEWAWVMSTVGDGEWSWEVPAGVGPRPIAQRVRSRLFEVAVHHADLGLGYTFRDWPAAFVADQLDRTLASLADVRTDAAVAGRWGVGRWLVEVGESVVVTEGAALAADGAVAGEDAALLAWLLGRESVDSAGLAVSGDATVAALPEWFPFP